MNRRQLIASALSISILPFSARKSLAGLSCGPTVMQNGQPLQGCSAGIFSPIALMMSTRQEYDQWCWAACIQMVFRYFGHNLPQAQIVRETWGQVTDMPASDEQIMQDLNRLWTDSAGNTFNTQANLLRRMSHLASWQITCLSLFAPWVMRWC